MGGNEYLQNLCGHRVPYCLGDWIRERSMLTVGLLLGVQKGKGGEKGKGKFTEQEVQAMQDVD